MVYKSSKMINFCYSDRSDSLVEYSAEAFRCLDVSDGELIPFHLNEHKHSCLNGYAQILDYLILKSNSI